MSRKRSSPAVTQLNELDVQLTTTNMHTASSSNQQDANLHGRMHNRSVFVHHQQLQKQQQTLLKTRTIQAASMTTSTTSATSASFPIQQSERAQKLKHWQDELLDFSTQITRHAHFTLDRITNYFRMSGMKFDANFRNHFLYTANNRWVDEFWFFVPSPVTNWDLLDFFLFSFQTCWSIWFVFDRFASEFKKQWLWNSTASLFQYGWSHITIAKT